MAKLSASQAPTKRFHHKSGLIPARVIHDSPVFPNHLTFDSLRSRYVGQENPHGPSHRNHAY
jgi:hypothetical protein